MLFYPSALLRGVEELSWSFLPFLKSLAGMSAAFGTVAPAAVPLRDGAVHHPFDIEKERARIRDLLQTLEIEDSGMTPAFSSAAPPFEDPYQSAIDRCERHPKDPTVLLTRNREDMVAVHSPLISAVIWVRDVSDELKAEVESLRKNSDVKQIAMDYRFNETPPEGIEHLRADMRMLAHLRAELAGEFLTRPILRTSSADKFDPDAPHLRSGFAGDRGFHSDRDDVPLRCHTTYEGETIQGLTQAAIERLEESGLKTDTTLQVQATAVEANITADDIVDDIPLYAVVAFKGRGYKAPLGAPDLGPSAPPHKFWRHRGPDRDRTDGMAGIFGRGFDMALLRESRLPFPEARI